MKIFYKKWGTLGIVIFLYYYFFILCVFFIIFAMKIVILDGNALNPGDLSYDVFKEFGEVTFYPITPAELTL